MINNNKILWNNKFKKKLYSNKIKIRSNPYKWIMINYKKFNIYKKLFRRKFKNKLNMKKISKKKMNLIRKN